MSQESTFQILSLVCSMLDKVLLSIFRATIVYFLRFYYLTSEVDSILWYHIFEMAVHFSAFLGGLMGLQWFKVLMFPTPICYLMGVAILGGTLMDTSLHDFSLIGAIFFGLGHGLMKVIFGKFMNYVQPDKLSNMIMVIAMVTDFIMLLLVPTFVFRVMGILISGIGIMVAVLVFGAIVLNLAATYDEGEYKTSTIYKCIMFGLMLHMNYGIQEAKKKSRKKKEVKKKKEKEIIKANHWLDRCNSKFGKDLVKDLKQMLTLNKFLWSFPGIWIAMELQYSYWMFNTYLLKRNFGSTILPSQFLCINPLIMLVLTPLFTFYLRPILRKLHIGNVMHLMVFGAIFLFGGAFYAWKASAFQQVHHIPFHEPVHEITKIAIYNGMDCDVHFQNHFVIDSQYWGLNSPRVLLAKLLSKGQKTITNNTLKLQIFVNILSPIIENTFLKYTDEDDDEETVGTIVPFDVEAADSITYFVPLQHVKDYNLTVKIQALTLCRKFDKELLNVGMETRANVGTKDVFLIKETPENYTIEKIPNLPYERNRQMKPGIRFLFANMTPIPQFDIYRNQKSVFTFFNPNNKKPEFIWMEEGDGPNLQFKMGKTIFSLNLTLEAGGLYDFIVLKNDTGAYIKVILGANPIQKDVTYILPLYFLIPIGEFLFAIYGVNFLQSQTPKKLRALVEYKRYFTMGMANLIIVFVTSNSSFLFMYDCQIVLTAVIGISVMVFTYQSWMHAYTFQPDFKREEAIATEK